MLVSTSLPETNIWKILSNVIAAYTAFYLLAVLITCITYTGI